MVVRPVGAGLSMACRHQGGGPRSWCCRPAVGAWKATVVALPKPLRSDYETIPSNVKRSYSRGDYRDFVSVTGFLLCGSAAAR